MTKQTGAPSGDTDDNAKTGDNGGTQGGDTKDNVDNPQDNDKDNNNNQDNDSDNKDNNDDDKGDSSMVPSHRLREEAEARRAAEAKVKEYEDAQAKRDEDEALKRGEHEKVIDWYKTKNTDLQAQLDTTTTRVETLEWVVKWYADAELEKIKEAHGEETLAKVQKLIDSDDPTVILAKLPTVVSMLWSTANNSPSYGKSHGWSSTAPSDELIKKAESGKMSYSERRQLEDSVSKSLDW